MIILIASADDPPGWDQLERTSLYTLVQNLNSEQCKVLPIHTHFFLIEKRKSHRTILIPYKTK